MGCVRFKQFLVANVWLASPRDRQEAAPVRGKMSEGDMKQMKQVKKLGMATITMLVLGALAFLPLPAQAANGTAYYFDNNGTTAGFGTASGTFNQNGTLWSTSSGGTLATAALPDNAQLTFGNVGTDLAGQTFTINMNSGLLVWSSHQQRQCQHHAERDCECLPKR